MPVRPRTPARSRLHACRRGSVEGLWVALAACLILAVAGTFFWSRTSGTGSRPVADQPVAAAAADGTVTGAADRTSTRSTGSDLLPPAVTVPAEEDQETAVAAAAPQPGTNPDSAESDSAVLSATDPVEAAQARREAVLAHVEFGEFTRAVEVANQAAGAEERSQLLGLVADAQLKIGDFDAALGSIRTMPDYNERRIALDRRGDVQALAGGSQADFTQLIELIMQETNGMWEEQDGSGGTISQFDQGVRVDPSGVLHRVAAEDRAGRLAALGIEARQALLNDDLARTSRLRVISLNRLEAAVARRLSEGREPVQSMKLLGGLTRVTHVFVYPEEGDVVLAGPAEAWRFNADGIPVGVDSGRPVVQLDDLVTLIRTFSTSDRKFFSCSINPRPEGLQQLKAFVEQTSSRPLSPGAGVRRWTEQLQEKLGRQDIVFTGIDPESRVARIIVEADYRMKLIGIGRYDFTGSRLPSIFDLMTPEEQRASKLDALRWWLTMKYDAVLHTADRNGFEFQGSSVLCQSENQFLNEQAQQIQTGQSEGANRLFAETFTARYQELASQDLVFADLQNVFDLALVAALLQHEGVARRAGWHPGVFAADGAYLTARHNAPLEVDSVVNHRVFRGRDIVVQVAGGVRADLEAMLDNPALFQAGVRLDSTAAAAQPESTLPARRWWWDAR